MKNTIIKFFGGYTKEEYLFLRDLNNQYNEDIFFNNVRFTEVNCNQKKLPNFKNCKSSLLIGQSGSGKTHFLENIIKQSDNKKILYFGCRVNETNSDIYELINQFTFDQLNTLELSEFEKELKKEISSHLIAFEFPILLLQYQNYILQDNSELKIMLRNIISKAIKIGYSIVFDETFPLHITNEYYTQDENAYELDRFIRLTMDTINESKSSSKLFVIVQFGPYKINSIINKYFDKVFVFFNSHGRKDFLSRNDRISIYFQNHYKRISSNTTLHRGNYIEFSQAHKD
ncbi:AAA family ATPase [Aliarcobacter butzleri]|uniref:AAA family ATPase n=1 Tax=Aliarcobacter butzleri TaxID=28197 RepID=UPI00344C4F87